MKIEQRNTKLVQTLRPVVGWMSMLIFTEVSTLAKLSMHSPRRIPASLIMEREVDVAELEDGGIRPRMWNPSLSFPLANEQRPREQN